MDRHKKEEDPAGRISEPSVRILNPAKADSEAQKAKQGFAGARGQGKEIQKVAEGSLPANVFDVVEAERN